MMNMLSSRLLNAGLIVFAAVLAPVAAFAQDATTASTMMDNSSPAIGFLVIWLLGIGGLLAVVAGTAVDKRAQAGRITGGITTRR